MGKRLNGDIKINLKEYYLNYMVLSERSKKEINVKVICFNKKEVIRLETICRSSIEKAICLF